MQIENKRGELKSLLLLPFDHRSSFSKNILKLEGDPKDKEIEEIKYLKAMIFEAFLWVWKNDSFPEELGILADEAYGKEILEKANKLGIITSVSVEKSGQDIFDFEYGEKFGEHIQQVNPTYIKALVRYNPQNKEINQKQLVNLQKLENFCQQNQKQLLFELLVPPNTKEAQDMENFETQIRPKETAEAILEISQIIHPKIWKLEGFSKEGWEMVLKVIPQESKVIVLGRGEDPQKVDFWLQEAVRFPNIIGFAVGRTVFMPPLVKFLAKELLESEAIVQISKNFERLVNNWRVNKNQSNKIQNN